MTEPPYFPPLCLPEERFLTSGWLSEHTEGSRSNMAKTAPGWMTTMSDEDEKEAGWEGLAKWCLRSVRARIGAGVPDVL